MDHQQVIQLILQFLQEHNYQSAFAHLERESSVSFDSSTLPNGGDLSNRLLELEELRQITEPLTTEEEKIKLDRGLRKEITETVASQLSTNIENQHSAAILSLKFLDDSPDGNLQLLTGSADKTVRFFSLKKDEENNDVCQLNWAVKHHTAAVLALDYDPLREQLITGSMDGSFSVLKMTDGELLQREIAHKKYISRIAFISKDLFVTTSYDHSIKFWRYDESAEKYNCVHTQQYGSSVESVASSEKTGRVIIGVRNDNYLHYIDATTLQDTTVNMNAYGDDHVSFTPMNLSLTPEGDYLLLSTDKDRLIMYRENSPFQVRSFWGTFHDGLSQPRACFSHGTDYVYSNSGGTKLLCWSVATAQLVSTFGTHSLAVRSLDLHPQKNLLASGSFDKTIKIWSPKTN